MSREDRLFARSLAGFVIAFATSVALFSFLFNYDAWLHGGMISVPEPERTRQFWVMQWAFSGIFGVAAFVPSVICHLIGLKIAKMIGTRSVFYYGFSAGVAALIILLLFFWLGFYSRAFEGEEGDTQVDVIRIGLLCAYSFVSGAVAGLIYWIASVIKWDLSQSHSS